MKNSHILSKYVAVRLAKHTWQAGTAVPTREKFIAPAEAGAYKSLGAKKFCVIDVI